MIIFLKGKIENIAKDYISLDVNNVGYKIYVNYVEKLKAGDNIKIYTYHHIRENIMDLYGFLDEDDLEFFNILLSVSGVGPKSAMNILGKAGRENIKKAVASQNADILTGIGKKTADRLITELKNKFKDVYADEYSGDNNFKDAIDGLLGLGYNKAEAFSALKDVPAEIKDVSERIKRALKNL